MEVDAGIPLRERLCAEDACTEHRGSASPARRLAAAGPQLPICKLRRQVHRQHRQRQQQQQRERHSDHLQQQEPRAQQSQAEQALAQPQQQQERRQEQTQQLR